MPEVIIDDYLASEESVVKRWSGEITGSKPSGDGEFAATDRRIALLTEDGDFKDIAYNHIISVESEIREPSDFLRYLPWTFMGIGVWLTIGSINLLSENSFLLGVILLLVGATIFIFGMKGVGSDWDEIREEQQTHKITLVTGDEREDQLTFETTENVGAVLSQKIRH